MTAIAASPTAETRRAGLARGAGRVPSSAWPFVMFLLLFVLGGILRPKLFGLDPLWSTAAFAMILAIASSGQTLAIIQGGIDLSIGNTITVSALSFLSLIASLGTFGALLAALLIGAAVGWLNGTVIAYLGVSPIVMTIAVNALLFGIVLLVFDFSQLTATPQIARDLTSGKVDLLGTAVPAIIPLGLVLLLMLQALLSRTGWGRSLYFLGSAPDAAELAGVPVNRMRVSAYMLSGALGALAGVVIAAFFGQTSVNMGDTYLLGRLRPSSSAARRSSAEAGRCSARSAARSSSARSRRSCPC
jgi:ribose transport system permease protein